MGKKRRPSGARGEALQTVESRDDGRKHHHHLLTPLLHQGPRLGDSLGPKSWPGPQIPPLLPKTLCEQGPPASQAPHLPASWCLQGGPRTFQNVPQERIPKSPSLALHRVGEAHRPGRGRHVPGLSPAGLAGKPPPDCHSSARWPPSVLGGEYFQGARACLFPSTPFSFLFAV